MEPVEFSFSEDELKLIEMGRAFIAVDVHNVNMNDLMRAGKVGAIVRCRKDPHECIFVVKHPDSVAEEAPLS
jgi:hypothetical protein